MVVDSSIQRITRLTPLRDVLAAVETAVGMVQPRGCAVEAALGRILAENVVASKRPAQPIALRDGYAVEAAAIADAGPYAPVPLASVPRRVDVGAPLPSGADAVAPLDAIARHGDRAEAVAAVLPGEGMLAAGGDAAPERPLCRAGKRLRSTDIAVLAAAGVATVSVREPCICVACGSAAVTPLIEATLGVLVRAVTAVGGTVRDTRREFGPLDVALADDQADAVIAVGGTGNGRQDGSVRALARVGRVEAHGIAASPGETAAFGFVGARPVLLVPGRIDATLAIWLLIGRHLVAKLAGSNVEDAPVMLPLKRKITSTIGLTELVPVACAGGMAEPLGSGYLSLEALARSDGWIVIAADSEGFGPGTQVAVRSWP